MNPRDRRRGFNIVELCVACALLGTAIPLTVSTLGAVARQRRAVETRQRGIEAADNLLERLTTEPWARLSADRLAEAEGAIAANEWLPGGRLQLELVELPGPPPGKRIDLELSWQQHGGGDRDRVRLSGWTYREAAGDD